MNTIEGFLSYDEVREEIMLIGNAINNGSGDSKLVNMARILAMKALINLFEVYTNMMEDNHG